MKLDIDPESPIPIYHQIADAIRRKIHNGELAPGAKLSPLREAAEDLGVNLHTVRHAYTELARQGLIESRRAAGTRVVGEPRQSAAPASGLEAFISRFVVEAEQQFGITAAELAAAVGNAHVDRRTRKPQVAVVECSQSQCRDLAEQLQLRWTVDARPWSLEREGNPSDDVVVATYFHYNEIRLRWPGRLPAIHFLSIRPDPGLADQLRALADGEPVTATLCELDEPTLEAVAADLSVTLPASEFSVAKRLLASPEQVFDLPGSEPLLLPPRVWGGAAIGRGRDDRFVQVRYVFDVAELDALGSALNWETNR